MKPLFDGPPTVSDWAKLSIPHSVRFLLTSRAWFGLSRGDIQGCFDNINHEKRI